VNQLHFVKFSTLTRINLRVSSRPNFMDPSPQTNNSPALE